MSGSVVALVDDLMDRSRVSAAIPDVAFVRSSDACAGAEVVIVDLAKHSVAAVRAAAPTARIVAFGSHVHTDALDEAERDGADIVLPRSRFFNNPATAITPPTRWG